MTGFRVTYATLSADDDELHAAFDKGIDIARGWLDANVDPVVSGVSRPATEATVVVSPNDHNIVIANVGEASPIDVDDAVTAADRAFAGWSRRPWAERVAVLDLAADLISAHRNELSALVSLEVGKNRLEALGDVEETADLIRYYTHQVATHDGFVTPMGRLNPAEATVDVLRPYGVWGVIAPFNFPAALAIAPVSAALVAGNSVVLKPSLAGTLIGLKLVALLHEAGVPADALQVVTGGDEVGRALVAHPGLDGLTFTGSYEAGMAIGRTFSGPYPRPFICEMGGKNPAIVMSTADVDIAAAGVMRSAFGLSGQKCSACSRVYVERAVYSDFLAALASKTAGLAVGDPIERGVYMGPVIDHHAAARYDLAVAEARAGGQVLFGGERLTEGALARGNYVAPTAVEVPSDSWLWNAELFVPFVAVAPVDSLDEALACANDTLLGLTAGFFSNDEAEIESFLDRIQAGVVYVNRSAGATTGAWPGVQPFGGWKGSGSGGKAGGGPYYVQQYLREQSRSVVSL
jgi:1-pyrroline-5-carboxylate dehydrogenase